MREQIDDAYELRQAQRKAARRRHRLAVDEAMALDDDDRMNELPVHEDDEVEIKPPTVRPL